MKISTKANDTIYDCLDVGDLQDIENEVADAFQGVLEALGIDTQNDHNTKDTARRVAKMFVHEIFRGRYYPPPKVTAFPNVKQYDQIYMSGPISINSTCAHHFQPITGKAYVGIFPGKKVVGLSKFNRMVDWVASRPQIQEEMTEQIADMIEQETEAKGVAVTIDAAHQCMTNRGVKKEKTTTVTNYFLGAFKDDLSFQNRYLRYINKD